MNPTHTPGPWSISNNRIHGATGSGAANGICDMLGNCGNTQVVNANARLIHAAPAMLKALQDLFEHCSMIHKHWGEGCNQRQAHAAIKAAQEAITAAIT